MRFNKTTIFLTFFAVILFFVNPLSAQMERYQRKSVSLFRLKLDGEMSFSQGRAVFEALDDQLNSMGRFDINPIPLRPGISLEKVFAIAKEYAESKQLDRAAKQFELMDEHYKEERITGETLDQIINGAYVIVPEIIDYRLSHEVSAFTDKNGNKSWKAKVNVSYGLRIEVWNAENMGTEENPDWKPDLEDTAVIRTVGSETKVFGKKPDSRRAAEDLADEAVNNSLFMLRLQMGKMIKSLEMFTIKAKVTESNLKKDMIKFDFGKDVGLNVDDPFKVVYYEKIGGDQRKKVDVAYMKVREVGDHESRSQALIIYNPDRMKESDLINPGDQVLEHPKMGLNLSVRIGTAPYSISMVEDDTLMHYYDGVDDYYFLSNQGEISSSGSIGLRAELDLAQFGTTSELYLVNDYTLLLNFPLIGAIGEFGIKKKFYKRQFGAFAGAGLGGWYVTGYIGDVPMGNHSYEDYMYQRQGDWSSAHIPVGSSVYLTGWSIGLNLNAGLEYLLSPEMSINFEGGYRLYVPVKDSMWGIEARDGGNTWQMEIDEFEAKPGKADISGLWFTLGFSYSL